MLMPRNVGGVVALATALLLVGASLHSAKGRAWKAGRVIDSHTSQERYWAGDTTNTSDLGIGQSRSTTSAVWITIKTDELAVIGDDYSYVIQRSVLARETGEVLSFDIW
jgi:hypothetical protein